MPLWMFSLWMILSHMKFTKYECKMVNTCSHSQNDERDLKPEIQHTTTVGLFYRRLIKILDKIVDRQEETRLNLSYETIGYRKSAADKVFMLLATKKKRNFQPHI